jgi:hypothetical protein
MIVRCVSGDMSTLLGNGDLKGQTLNGMTGLPTGNHSPLLQIPARKEPPMPADLKKVAREIVDLGVCCYTNAMYAEQVESRLETLVSEVRAQAMEEAAKIADGFWTGTADWVKLAGPEIAKELRRQRKG